MAPIGTVLQDLTGAVGLQLAAAAHPESAPAWGRCFGEKGHAPRTQYGARSVPHQARYEPRCSRRRYNRPHLNGAVMWRAAAETGSGNRRARPGKVIQPFGEPPPLSAVPS